MSNVRYGCPTNPETGCGARLFAAPGGTTHKCRFHDQVMVQVEEWYGPTFEYIEDAAGNSRTGKATHLRTHAPTPEHPDILTNIKPAPDVKVVEHVDEAMIKYRLQERYRKLYGKNPDRRFGIAKLREKVAAKEEVLERESKNKLEREKAAAAALEAQRENV